MTVNHAGNSSLYPAELPGSKRPVSAHPQKVHKKIENMLDGCGNPCYHTVMTINHAGNSSLYPAELPGSKRPVPAHPQKVHKKI
jgi:hypothetical protein